MTTMGDDLAARVKQRWEPNRMNLPDTARHLADLDSKLNDAINQVEDDPKLAAVAKDLA